MASIRFDNLGKGGIILPPKLTFRITMAGTASMSKDSVISFCSSASTYPKADQSSCSNWRKKKKKKRRKDKGDPNLQEKHTRMFFRQIRSNEVIHWLARFCPWGPEIYDRYPGEICGQQVLEMCHRFHVVEVGFRHFSRTPVRLLCAWKR